MESDNIQTQTATITIIINITDTSAITASTNKIYIFPVNPSIRYSSGSITVNNSSVFCTMEFPKNQEATVIFPDITGYNKPSALNITVGNEDSKNIAVEYTAAS